MLVLDGAVLNAVKAGSNKGLYWSTVSRTAGPSSTGGQTSGGTGERICARADDTNSRQNSWQMPAGYRHAGPTRVAWHVSVSGVTTVTSHGVCAEPTAGNSRQMASTKQTPDAW